MINENNIFGNIERLGEHPNLYFELNNANFIDIGEYHKGAVRWEFFGHKYLCILACILSIGGNLQGKLFIKAGSILYDSIPRYSNVYVLDLKERFSARLNSLNAQIFCKGMFNLDDGSLQTFLLENCSILSMEDMELMWVYDYYHSLEVYTALKKGCSSKLFSYIKLNDIKYIIENLKEEYLSLSLYKIVYKRYEIYRLQSSLSYYYNLQFSSVRDLLVKFLCRRL